MSGRCTRTPAGSPETARLPATAGSTLQPTGLDPDAPTQAGRAVVRASNSLPRPGGL